MIMDGELRSNHLPKLTEIGAWRVPRFGQFGERMAPKPGEKATVGGFYTQADIREIIQYAKIGMSLYYPKLMSRAIVCRQLLHIPN